MSETKYTPGPWTYCESEEGHEIRMGSAVLDSSRYEAQHFIDYRHGCILDEDSSLPDDPENIQFLEAEANARLIAAAPDMEELIGRMVREFESLIYFVETGGRVDATCPAIPGIRSAVSDAKQLLDSIL